MRLPEKSLPWFLPGLALFLCRPGMLLGIFDFRVFFLTEGLLGILTAGFLLGEAGRLKERFRCLPPEVRIGEAILILAGLFHAFRGGYLHPEVLGQGLFLPALSLVVLLDRKGFLKSLKVFCAFFWVLAAGVLFAERITGNDPFGITGNWNWSSMLLIACAPFVLLVFRRTRAFLWLCLPVVLVTAWGVFHHKDSRTAIISLGAACFLLLLLRFRKQRKVLFLSVLLLGAAGTGLFLRSGVSTRILKEEIRTELFAEAFSLIRHHPFGVGFCGYENSIIPFKTAEYHLHPLAAERTVHPHNELLYLASAAGIPAALALLVIAITLTGKFMEKRDRHRLPPEETAVFFSCSFLFVCSMGDLSAHAWPLNWISAFLTGLMLPVKNSRPSQAESPLFLRLAGAVFLAAALCFALCNGYASSCLHLARKAFRKQDFPTGALLAEKGLKVPFFEPEEIYFAAVSSFRASPEKAQEFAELLQKTPWKDFAHVHLLLGNIHASRWRHAEAVEEYRKDALCYPWDPRPLEGIIGCLERVGSTERLPEFRKRAAELRRLKEGK